MFDDPWDIPQKLPQDRHWESTSYREKARRYIKPHLYKIVQNMLSKHTDKQFPLKEFGAYKRLIKKGYMSN